MRSTVPISPHRLTSQVADGLAWSLTRVVPGVTRVADSLRVLDLGLLG